MIDKAKSSETSTAYGKKLDTPIKFSWEWKEYPDFATLKSAGDMLSEEEQLKTRNTEREAKARGKALTAALKAAGYEKPTEENDPQIGLKNMKKTLLTAKKPDGTPLHTEESAKALAAQMLGVAWDE